MQTIEENRAARLAGTLGQLRNVSPRTRALLRMDKEKYVRVLPGDIEGCFITNNFRPPDRGLKKLNSKSTSQMYTIRTTDLRIVSDIDEVRSRGTEYFGQLFSAKPPIKQLSLAGVQILAADSR